MSSTKARRSYFDKNGIVLECVDEEQETPAEGEPSDGTASDGTRCGWIS